MRSDDQSRGRRSEVEVGALAQTAENRRVIRTCMKRWQDHNAYGRSIGRGLSEADLIDRVAGETGATLAFIRSSLRSPG